MIMVERNNKDEMKYNQDKVVLYDKEVVKKLFSYTTGHSGINWEAVFQDHKLRINKGQNVTILGEIIIFIDRLLSIIPSFSTPSCMSLLEVICNICIKIKNSSKTILEGMLSCFSYPSNIISSGINEKLHCLLVPSGEYNLIQINRLVEVIFLIWKRRMNRNCHLGSCFLMIFLLVALQSISKLNDIINQKYHSASKTSKKESY